MSTPNFEDKEAVREAVPLLVGIAGPSGSGKTYSSLRLATGMQLVLGGDIFFIDTEHKRALHYADRFKFRHVDFGPPFTPLRYLEAIQFCASKGAKIIITDSMTHEHSGEGGIMDQSDAYLAKKCGDNEADRQKHFMSSLKDPKAQRNKLNTRIVQMGINAVFCYRAHEKVKPVPGKGIINLGFQPETTSPLVYEMTARFLLQPGSDGKPEMAPESLAEKMLTKNPEQFRGWFNPGVQLDEEIGRKLAEWAKGGPMITVEEEALGKANKGLTVLQDFWKTLTPAQQKKHKGQLDVEWKPIALRVDEEKQKEPQLI